LSSYLDHLRIYAKPSTFVWASHQARLAPLAAADVDQFINDRLASGVTRETINGTLRYIRAEANFCGAPIPKLKLLKTTRRLPTILSASNVHDLINESSGYVQLAILLAARAGLRLSEIEHLRGCDVTGGTISVVAHDGWSPKSHAEREIPTHRSLVGPLRLLRIAPRGAATPFPIARLGASKGLAKGVKAAFDAVGLGGFRRGGLHALRRTWASQMLAAGADIETVRELGGWADLEVVLRYVASTTPRKVDAITRLE